MRILFNRLYRESFSEFNKLITQFIEEEQKKVIVTANPETFYLANTNKILYNHLLEEDVILIPDGIGVVKGGRKLGYNIKERLPGIEVVVNALEIINQYPNKKVYLYGSKKEVISDMKSYIKGNYSNLSIVGAIDGYNYDDDEVFKEIIKLEPDLILVALGIPKQEKLIFKYINKFKKGIFIGVGGSFDVLSGHKKRAPQILIKLNLEWLYRLIKEPSRIKTFFQVNIKFIFLIRKIKNEVRK